jgi:hypothetical protein
MARAKRALLWVAVSTAPQAQDDKESLPAQERDLRAAAEQYGWDITDVLIVPGHSRRYVDIHELAKDAKTQNIHAFERLLEHFRRKDFDILACRDGERFARTQSLHAYIVESVIGLGGQIFSLSDGFIDDNNFRMFVAMAGYKAASDIDRLQKFWDMAMTAKAQRGLPISKSVSWSHKIIRDEFGKAIAIIPDPTKTQLFQDAVPLLLEGVSFNQLEHELYTRFGHVNEVGEPYRSFAIYRIIYSPIFWGNSARHHTGGGKGTRYKIDTWVFDPTDPIPEGVIVFYNTHKPALEETLGAELKAELKRRKLVTKGRSRPYNTQRFVGLFVCAGCGYYLQFRQNQKGHGYYCCESRHRARKIACNEPLNRIPEKKIKSFMDDLIRQLIKAGGPELLNEQNENGAALWQQQHDTITQNLKDLEDQIKRLMQKQAASSDDLADLYDDELRKSAERRRILKESLKAHNIHRPTSAITQDQRDALEVIEECLETFWELPTRRVNQLLHRLAGNRRVIVKGREIIGFADAPSHTLSRDKRDNE